MKSHLLAAMLWVALTVTASAATTPLFQNNGIQFNQQIDALAILNNGTLNYTTSLPFAPNNTSYLTNTAAAVIDGNVGFTFGTPQKPYANFLNRGRIQGTVNLVINSTGFTNTGRLAVAPQGLLRVTGKNVNLSHSVLTSGGGSSPATTDGFSAGDFYLNPSGVTDLYWGAGTNNVFDPPGGTVSMLLNTFNLTNLTTPAHEVQFAGNSFTNRIRLPNFGGPGRAYEAHVFTNRFQGENIVQVVFVPVDTNVLTTVRFGPSGGLESTPIIEFAAPDVDLVTGTPFTNYVYLVDDFATLGQAHAILQTNIDNQFVVPDHFKPEPYKLFRTAPFQWLTAVPSNTPFSTALLNGPNYISNRVGDQYIAWSVQVGKPLTFLGTTPLTDPTNAGGRIEISANNLDISSTSIRSETYLSINTTNLVNISNSVMEAPFIDFLFTTTNKTLTVNSFVNPTVRRLSGNLSAWSGLWTNRTTNIPADNVQFHALVVDHRFTNFQAVSLGTFSAKGSNLILASPLAAQRVFKVDAPSVAFGTNSTVRLAGDLGVTQLPTARDVTNLGSLFIANNLVFGGDTAQPYNTFLNAGILDAGSINIRARTASIGGTNTTHGGPFIVDGTTVVITNATLSLAGDFQVSAANFTATNDSITSKGALVFSVTNNLTDNGTTNNVWTSSGGFQFLTKPATGDLLGTTIHAIAPLLTPVQITAASADRGRTSAGFLNNAAIGHLVLDGALGSFFSFGGLGISNALYVDYLELTNQATNFLTAMDISSDLVIYFADSNIPADKLDNSFSGRLRWVKSYAGIFGGTNITLPPRFGETVGATITVNRSLLSNSSLDSDADGIVNFTDLSPFDGVMINPPVVTASNIILSWTAAAQTVYRVECSTNFMAPTTGTWMAIADVTNNATITTNLSYADALSHSNCVYRINYMPSGQFP